MLNHLDSISMGVFFLILIHLGAIVYQHHKMGTIKNSIIEASIIMCFALNVIAILNIVEIYGILEPIHKLVFLTAILLYDISFIFFKNNIRQKGIVINLKNIFWKDIRRIRKTNHYIEIFYNKDKRIFLDIFNFDASFLEKECEKRKIPLELPQGK